MNIHAVKALQPMTLTIPLENTIVALRELHPTPSDLVLQPTFDYQPKHTFVLHRILFAQTLAITPPFVFGWAFWDGI
jgi:hypothetical protein